MIKDLRSAALRKGAGQRVRASRDRV